MNPFKKGFVLKCAQYGIEKEQAKDLFEKIAINWDAMLPALGASAGVAGTGGLINYLKNKDLGRAALVGGGTLLGSGLGAVGGGLGGAYAGKHIGESANPMPNSYSPFTVGQGMEASHNIGQDTALGGLAGLGVGGVGGGIAGYNLADILAGHQANKGKKEQEEIA
jgi:hypothetical protein